MSKVLKPSSEPEKNNLWCQILRDVQNNGNPKLPSCKQILVLGDNESGKTTIVAKLRGVEEPKKGSGLEFAYINIRDDYRDDQTRLSVWILDGDTGHSDLLKFALNENTFEHTLVILTVTMTAPWSILEQLQHWTSVLANHLDKINLNADERQALRQYIAKMWQDYIEPGDELDPTSTMKHSSRTFSEGEDAEESASLPEGILTNNLGLDIVVVVTKTDFIQTLEKEQGYRSEHLDFIQKWIRKFCLQYGAALFYTSAKEDKNCDLLYKYLTHRIYGFPFHTPALVVEKDAVLIPAGWDNMNKIRILYENLHLWKPDKDFKEVIVQTTTRKTIHGEVEILAEDEQSFLARQQQIIFGGANNIPVVERLTEDYFDARKMINSPGGRSDVANFFKSLLNK